MPRSLAVLCLWLATVPGIDAQHVVLISVDGLAAFYLDDPRAPMPTLQRLARQGATATGMVTSFPSVTWPSHTSLVTGAAPARHGVLSNRVLDAKTGAEVTYIGDPVLTKQQAVRVPTLYDAVHQAGMKTASVIWPATVAAPTLNWTIPDSNVEAIIRQHTTPGLAAELDAAGISIRQLGAWAWNRDYSFVRDITYSRIAAWLLDNKQPNLLLLHLITGDNFQHSYGPGADEVYPVLAFLDERIREVWDALQRPPLAGKGTLMVASDHGFAAVDHTIHPNVVLQEMGLLAAASRKAWFASHGGSGGVYLLEGAGDAALLRQIAERISKLEGVDRVILPEEFPKLGMPDPGRNPQQPHLMFSAKPGYSFSSDYKENRTLIPVKSRQGAHGHLPDQPFMHAAFVASGAAIRPGTRLDKISNLDVAPTIAAILGVKLPSAEGNALRSMLR